MNKKELEEYQEKLMKGAKGTVGLGVLTGLGSYAFGRVGAAHPTVRPAAQATVSGLQLAQVGNLAAVGMSLMPESKESKKKTGSKEVDKILGL